MATATCRPLTDHPTGAGHGLAHGIATRSDCDSGRNSRNNHPNRRPEPPLRQQAAVMGRTGRRRPRLRRDHFVPRCLARSFLALDHLPQRPSAVLHFNAVLGLGELLEVALERFERRPVVSKSICRETNVVQQLQPLALQVGFLEVLQGTIVLPGFVLGFGSREERLRDVLRLSWRLFGGRSLVLLPGAGLATSLVSEPLL
jgi:hypothetical protein